jgi:hypothetical protein
MSPVIVPDPRADTPDTPDHAESGFRLPFTLLRVSRVRHATATKPVPWG